MLLHESTLMPGGIVTTLALQNRTFLLSGSLRWNECTSHSWCVYDGDHNIYCKCSSICTGELNALQPTGTIYQQGPCSVLPLEVWCFNNSWNVFSVLPWPCTTQSISHSMAPLPCIQVCQSDEGAMSISNCSVAPVISHRQCHCYISFKFYKHYSTRTLSSKCVY